MQHDRRKQKIVIDWIKKIYTKLCFLAARLKNTIYRTFQIYRTIYLILIRNVLVHEISRDTLKKNFICLSLNLTLQLKSLKHKRPSLFYFDYKILKTIKFNELTIVISCTINNIRKLNTIIPFCIRHVYMSEYTVNACLMSPEKKYST